MQVSVRKNSIPYIQPYSVVDDEGNVLGNYNTLTKAKGAAKAFETMKKADVKNDAPAPKDGFDALKRRMSKPDGDKIPKKRQRRIIIDDD